ncbi:unnamed protein product, partial [Mycena citricolor]
PTHPAVTLELSHLYSPTMSSPTRRQLSYDFPSSASSSSSSTHSASSRRTRPRSPVRPRWETASPVRYLEEEDEEMDYDAYGYPRIPSNPPEPYTTLPRTGNQWVRPPSPTTPSYYTGFSPYPPAYQSWMPGSADSDTSALSAAASEKEHTHHPLSPFCHAPNAKIRKSARRRSLDEPKPVREELAPARSSFDSPRPAYLYPTYQPRVDEEEDDVTGDEEPTVVADKENVSPSSHSPSSLRRHWAALSLRVRFGVFRAKRRMRDRVLSL